MKIYFDRTPTYKYLKNKRSIPYSYNKYFDTSIFLPVSKYYVETYMTTYLRQDKTEFIKFTNYPPLDFQNGGELPVGSYNNYGHKVINIEKCWVYYKNREDFDIKKNKRVFKTFNNQLSV